MADWSQPQDVTKVDYIFGGEMDNLLPAWDDIPDDFKNDHSGQKKWRDFQSTWFFLGLSEKTTYKPKPGIDQSQALAHLGAIQSSWAPKHQHKQAAVAWLASLWFKNIKVVPAKDKIG